MARPCENPRPADPVTDVLIETTARELARVLTGMCDAWGALSEQHYDAAGFDAEAAARANARIVELTRRLA